MIWTDCYSDTEKEVEQYDNNIQELENDLQHLDQQILTDDRKVRFHFSYFIVNDDVTNPNYYEDMTKDGILKIRNHDTWNS